MNTNFKRILSFAVNDFRRNEGISIAAIFVLVVTIMLVTGLVFFQGTAGYLTSQIRDKIDITAYFVDGTAEQDVLAVKDKILSMSPNITGIEYISKDQALANFNEKHQDNSILTKALQEVGDNPFLPALNITTNGNPDQFAQVSNILQTSDFSNLIDKVDFSQKKDTIEKVYSITTRINVFGIIFGILLVIVAVLVVLNTVKLGIESSKEEISTMRIVGASDGFIRGPFIIQGIMYGVIAFIISFILSALAAAFLSSNIAVVLPGFSMLHFFLANWWLFVLIQLGFGVGVGAASALIVVKKYLSI